MRFSIGYWAAGADGPSVVEVCRRYAGRISEVYFAWAYAPSGRSPLGASLGERAWDAAERLMADLRAIAAAGVELNLLLNANCYGRRAVSVGLGREVCSLVEYLQREVGLAAVTTTSPFIARVLRDEFPSLELRASVNMRIGTVKGMEYVAELFDGFYVQRECNRDIGQLERLRQWADDRGKRLYMLANSGCLRHCSCQTFHDNLVAHEGEVAEVHNAAFNPAICWSYLARRENWPAVLQNSWVRPEDVGRYEGLVDAAKLATRMHARPWVVAAAYCEGHYAGNLLDLLEPGHGSLFEPWIVDNTRFPADWWQTVVACDKTCERCSYCADVLEQVLVDSRDI